MFPFQSFGWFSPISNNYALLKPLGLQITTLGKLSSDYLKTPASPPAEASSGFICRSTLADITFTNKRLISNTADILVSNGLIPLSYSVLVQSSGGEDEWYFLDAQPELGQ